MDMSVFSKELESAGFSTPEIKGNRFNKKEDLVLPFIASSPELYQIDRKIINDANYIYSAKKAAYRRGICRLCKNPTSA